MGDEAVPDMQGEVGVATTEAGYKFILVLLDGAFGGIGAMKVWRNELELDTVIAQKFFYAAGAFIVKHLVLGVRPRSERWECRTLVARMSLCLLLEVSGSARMALLSWSYKTMR